MITMYDVAVLISILHQHAFSRDKDSNTHFDTSNFSVAQYYVIYMNLRPTVRPQSKQSHAFFVLCEHTSHVQHLLHVFIVELIL